MALEIPGYKIRKTIGKGGMATVYLAEQEIFERNVALKVMSRALADDPTFGQRFFREAKIVSQLVHPNIVTVYDVGVHNDTYYLSMEYIDGGDLKSRRSSLSLGQKFRAVRDIAKALDYAGAKRFIHRDIKPENIMFHKADGRAVLMDFGIARAAESDHSMTQTGTAIGTPHYMSPEQAKGQQVDPRSDLYSLGVVFYLLLVGSVPYDAESAVAIGIKHITEPIPKLPKGYELLQPVINRLMAKKPEDRYQTAREFLSVLTRINIPRVENAIRQGYSSEDKADPDAKTMQTPAVAGAAITQAELETFGAESDEDDPVKPTFVPFEDQDFSDYGKRSAVWAWGSGFIALLLFASFVFYKQKPELAKPWLEKAATVISDTTTKIVEQVKVWIPEENAGESVPEQSAIDPASAPKPKSELKARPMSAPVLPIKSAPTATPKSAKVAVAEQPTPKPSPMPIEALVTPVPSPEVDMDSPAILALRDKVQALNNAYFGERDKLPDLVDAYRALIANVPGDKRVLKEMEQLKNGEIKRIKDQSLIGDIEEANKRLLQVRYLFPEFSAKEYRNLEKWVARQEKIYRLLAEGEELYLQNTLTVPKNNSALSRYRQVLEIDSDNKTAKAGLRKISEKLSSIARSKLKQGNESEAKRLADKAMAIDAKNANAKKIANQLEAKEKARRYRVELLEKAEQRLNSGDLFEPETNSAYYFYARVLKQYPGDQKALQGLDSVIEALSSRVWGLVGEERFAQAKAELVRPMRIMGQTPRLVSLSNAVNEVVSEKAK